MEEARLARLMEEFVSRIRRGESPDPEDYASRYPQLAERIRELFPTLTMLENAVGTKIASLVRQEGLSAGTVIGAYYIRKEIGRGGLGIVYEAIRITTQKRVALKVLPLHAHLNTKRLERFFREARITADLKHPNIIPIFDIGQAGDTAYFAMQYIEGSGLDHYFKRLQKEQAASGYEYSDSSTDADRRNRFDIPQYFTDHLEWVAHVGIQAASGLAYAHSRNLIHRDIKPSNLLQDTDGRLWIADFGLARNLEDTTLTATGVLLGTPRYMSPEQAEAGTKRLDQRSDIYSLGVTLYELITCHPVFDGDTPREILFQILTRNPVAPRRLNRSIPKDMDRIILRAIHKNPEDRYQSAADLEEDFKRWLNREPVRARSWKSTRLLPKTFQNRHKSIGFTFLLILILAISGSWHYQKDSRNSPTQGGTTEKSKPDTDAADSIASNPSQPEIQGGLTETAPTPLISHSTEETEPLQPTEENPFEMSGNIDRPSANRASTQAKNSGNDPQDGNVFPASPGPGLTGKPADPDTKLQHKQDFSIAENANPTRDAPANSPLLLSLKGLYPKLRPPTPDQNQENAFIDAPITIKIGTTVPTDTVWHEMTKELKQEWEEISVGGIRVRIFENGNLGTENEMTDMVRSGEIGAVALSTMGLTQIDVSFSCLQIPMMIHSNEELNYVLQRIRPELEKKLEVKEFKLLFLANTGWIRTFSKQPVYTFMDLKRMELSTSPGGVDTEDFYKKLGFKVKPMLLSNLIPSFQKDIINAVNLPPYYVFMTGVHNFVPNMTEIYWAPDLAAIVMDMELWNSVPERYHSRMLAAVRNIKDEYQEKFRNFEENSIREMQLRGLNVIELDDHELTVWQKEMEKTYPKIKGTYVPAESFDEVQRLVIEHRKSAERSDKKL